MVFILVFSFVCVKILFKTKQKCKSTALQSLSIQRKQKKSHCRLNTLHSAVYVDIGYSNNVNWLLAVNFTRNFYVQSTFFCERGIIYHSTSIHSLHTLFTFKYSSCNFWQHTHPWILIYSRWSPTNYLSNIWWSKSTVHLCRYIETLVHDHIIHQVKNLFDFRRKKINSKFIFLLKKNTKEISVLRWLTILISHL